MNNIQAVLFIFMVAKIVKVEDSNYYCDIDMYSKKGQPCVPCSDLCGADPEQRSMTCSQYCPSFSLKASSDSPGKHAISILAIVLGIFIVRTVVITLVKTVAAAAAAVVICASVVYFTKKKKLDTGNTSEGTTVPLTDSHQNTETTQEDAQSQTSQRLQGDSQTTT